MKGILTDSQKDYILFHLRHCISAPETLFNKILYLTAGDPLHDIHGSIIFYSSSSDLALERIVYHEDVPILFPVMNSDRVFDFDEKNKNIIFNHDLIKSAFYLLSGYQEYINKESKDSLGRFSFQDSIQHKLGCTHKPVVNYYFEWIVNGIAQFGRANGFDVYKKNLFRNFGFLLSHDVDNIDQYTIEYCIYKLKEIFGIRKTPLSVGKNIKLFMMGFLKWTRITKNDNPYWNFEFMRTLEKRNGFRSTFYFLDKGIRHHDAYYDFNEERLKSLYQLLISEGCEIGSHGTVRSVADEVLQKRSLLKLKLSSSYDIKGIRQHRLLWVHPITAIVQSKAGFEYDTSLGFAEHEGFRNSYAFPFKPYDFDDNAIVNIWEFPLIVMDVTLFAYRKLNPDDALEKCKNLIEELRKFNGLFTLLWHNSFFDEETYPGVTIFYKNLLSMIAEHNPDNLLGCELVEIMKKQ